MRQGLETSRRGMTLIELLLAIGLIVMVSAMMFMFYNSTLRSRDEGIKAMTDGQLARVIAMKIADEIRSANGFVRDLGPGISGDERMITIQTIALVDKEVVLRRSVQDEPLPGQCDIRQVQYYLAYDEDEPYVYPDGTDSFAPMGLVRREVRTPYQPALGGSQSEETVIVDRLAKDLDLLAPEMKYVRFRYFDGVDWVDDWDIAKDIEGQMGNSLPQAVEVTVGYKELPPREEEEEDPDEDKDLIPSEPELYDRRTFTVVVRLSQADPFLGSRLMRAQRRSRLSSGEGG
ncbi:MAG: prepilin-type N-terminal cleavage/methylation domain-containing protein [Phycisphaerae bacterium]|nr:prepilin-type N-terminal cleavage/methylation domain-containing protein [Phycisphaerae bacterium]